MSEICQESDMNKPYKKDPQTIQALTELQFSVTQKSATERPFTGEYDDHFEDGLYAVSYTHLTLPTKA